MQANKLWTGAVDTKNSRCSDHMMSCTSSSIEISRTKFHSREAGIELVLSARAVDHATFSPDALDCIGSNISLTLLSALVDNVPTVARESGSRVGELVNQ